MWAMGCPCQVQKIPDPWTDKYHMQQCKSKEALLLAQARVQVSSGAVASRQGPRLSLADHFYSLLVRYNTSSANSSYLSHVTPGRADAPDPVTKAVLHCPLHHVEEN